MNRLLLIATLASLAAMNVNAQTSFSGFWKVNCEDAFGLQIKPAEGSLYSVLWTRWVLRAGNVSTEHPNSR